MSFRICTLFSGSGGNSTYIRYGADEILIDAGKSARTLCRALTSIGSDISNISAIFITHEHTDHVSALETLSKAHSIPIHITELSAKRFDKAPEAYIHKNLIRHKEIEYTVTVGDLTLKAFRTPHDSMMSVGYRIETNNSSPSQAIAIATDMGYVTENTCKYLEGCEAVVLESNHDEEMLKRGPYPYDLKMRILSNKGHLSNKASAELGAYLAKKGTKAFLLAHLSEENNSPDIASDEFFSAIADENVTIAVADPEFPTELLYSKGDL